ncbi:MAG: ATPase [Desulfobacteraceae bacterium]|nr:MAG: ATPase [Desulfobacteraceae bacterium]
MINVDKSVFIQIINFLFLIWAMNVVLYKPIRKILLQRKEKIAGLEQSIENFGKNAQEKEDAYASGIKEARAKGQKEKEALLLSAQNEEKQLIEKINKKAQEDLVQMRNKIAKDTESVRSSLQNEVDTFAAAIGQKILGRVI